MTCLHPQIELDYTPYAANDTSVVTISISLRCTLCGPFRWLGVAPGLSLCRPCLSADGLSLSLPALPEFEEVEHERRMDA